LCQVQFVDTDHAPVQEFNNRWVIGTKMRDIFKRSRDEADIL